MATKLGDTLTTREAIRRAAIDDVVTRAELASVKQDGGPLDGLQVVSIGVLREQVIASLLVPLPPPSDRYAEVSAPADVLVSAPCPECHETVTTTMEIHQKLTVENNVRNISLKGTAEAVVHMHGQRTLDDAGQVTVDEAVGQIEDLRLRILRAVADVGDAHAAETNPGPIPSLEAIAIHLELATDSDRGDLEESLHAYSQLEEALVEVVSVKGEPPTYVLTEAGLAMVAEADAADADGDDA